MLQIYFTQVINWQQKTNIISTEIVVKNPKSPCYPEGNIIVFSGLNLCLLNRKRHFKTKNYKTGNIMFKTFFYWTKLRTYFTNFFKLKFHFLETPYCLFKGLSFLTSLVSLTYQIMPMYTFCKTFSLISLVW